MSLEIDDASRALLQEVLERSCGAIHCQNSAVWINNGDYLQPILGVGPHAEHFINNYSHPIDEGIISMVYASGQPFCENNIHANPQHSSRLDEQLGVQTDAMIATPVVSQGEIIGVITAVHTSPTSGSGKPLSFQATDLNELQFAAALTGRVLDSLN